MPIYQNPSYWPMTFRITPNWHLENKNKVGIDAPGTTTPTSEQSITTHGFDLSGLDIWTAGTYSDISGGKVWQATEQFHAIGVSDDLLERVQNWGLAYTDRAARLQYH
jgi:hypothetical protein